MRKRKNRYGLTLVELIIAFAIIVLVFAAIVPQFRAIRNSWASTEAGAAIIQNGRVLAEHITRNLAAAKQIVSVSPSGSINGFIIFKDNNDIQKRYMFSGGYVVFGEVGSEAQLAGPVDRFQISCWDVNDFSNPTTDGNNIRLVRVETDFPNADALGTDKTFSSEVFVQANAQSQCWQKRDIGSVAAAGSASSASCVWTIGGSGADIWGTADEFYYVYQSLSGDGQIIARVASITNTDSWAKAGVMIRETLNADSKHAMMVVTSGNGTAFQRRTSTGGSSDNDNVPGRVAPYWVKLTRVGNTFSGYESSNGSAWTQVGSSVSITMATDVYVGLAVTSHNDGVLCTAVIDNVAFSAITYETFSERQVSSDSNTTIVIPKPSGTAQGDLLIAAVATDESSTPFPANGWTPIDCTAYGTAVTLGAWRKIAGASEPANYTFTWTGGQKAYGWIMRFTGYDAANPINTSATADQTSSTPTSPAVTTTVNNCLILRLGAFDDSGITVGSPGLTTPLHIPITMNSSGGSSASPTYQAAGTAQSGTGAITVAWPAHQAGDIALLFVESCGGQAITLSTPAGFANVTNSPQATGTTTNGTRITVYWCRATSSSMSSPVVQDPGNHVYGRILTFRNVVATGNPWDVTAGGTKATASTTTTFGAVTTSVNNTLIVLAASRDNDSAAAAWSGWTNANLSSLTERSDEGTTSGNGGGVGVATGVKSTAGSTGSTTATVTSSVDGHMTIALAPAAVTGTVSGGAGYIKQPTAGLSSGTPTFSLTASNEARMLTIAITPADNSRDDCCQDNIIP